MNEATTISEIEGNEPKAALSAIDALGAMLSAPLTTLFALLNRGSSAFACLVFFFATQAVLLSGQVYWSWVMSKHAPFTALQKLWRSLVEHSRNDLFFALGAWGILFLAVYVLSAPAAKRARSQNTFVVACHLLLPLALLQLLGASLSYFGHEFWFMPHRAVDSRVVIVGRQISWFRVIVKNIVSYGPSVLLLLGVLYKLYRQKREPLIQAAFKPRLKRAGLIPILLLLAVGIAGGVKHAQKNQRWLKPVVPGDSIASVDLPWLTTSQSRVFNLDDYRGKVVLLDFWASWCGPCLRAMPDISKLHDKYKDQGFTVIGINREPNNPQKARATLQRLNVSFPSALDKRRWGDRLGLRSLPTSMLIDKEGVLRELHLGYTNPETVDAEVSALLAQ